MQISISIQQLKAGIDQIVERTKDAHKKKMVNNLKDGFPICVEKQRARATGNFFHFATTEKSVWFGFGVQPALTYYSQHVENINH